MSQDNFEQLFAVHSDFYDAIAVWKQQEQLIALEKMGFPTADLPKQIQAIIQCIMKQTQASKDLVASSVLASISPTVHDLYSVVLHDGERHFSLSLNMVIVAGSGEGKSSVAKFIKKTITDTECTMSVQYDENEKSYKNSRAIWEMKKKALDKAYESSIKRGEDVSVHYSRLLSHLESEPVRPVPQYLMVNDITIAALKNTLSSGSPFLFLFSDEAGGILNSALFRDAYFLNQLWDDEHNQRMDRDGRTSRHILDTRLCYLLMTQQNAIDELMKFQNGKVLSSGLFARLLVCMPESRLGKRNMEGEYDQITNAEKDALLWYYQRQQIYLLESLARRSHQTPRRHLTLDPAAEAIWIEDSQQVEERMGTDEAYRPYREFGAKYAEHVIRIAGCLEAFCTGGPIISAQTMRAAISITAYYFEQHIKLCGDNLVVKQEGPAVLLKKWLDKQSGNALCFKIEKNKVLQNGPKALRSIKVLNQAIQELASTSNIHEVSLNQVKGHKAITLLVYYKQVK